VVETAGGRIVIFADLDVLSRTAFLLFKALVQVTRASVEEIARWFNDEG